MDTSTTPKHIVPPNTALPSAFYTTFNISPAHVQQNNVLPPPPPPPKEQTQGHIVSPHSQHPPAQVDVEALFEDWHEDHSVLTNIDLCYEVLYQAHVHVPGWKTIPFEIFASIVDIKPITGGLSNILVSLELNEQCLTDKTLQESRPQTIQKILQKIHAEIKSNDDVTVPVLENPLLLRPVNSPFSSAPETSSSSSVSVDIIPHTDFLNRLSGPDSPSSRSNQLVSLDGPALQRLTEQEAAILTPTLSHSNLNQSTSTDVDSMIPAIIPVASLPLTQNAIQQLSLHKSEYLYITPSITKVAVRIYGTSEFTNRATELGLAKSAADADVSEIIFASWRHGRITSFLTGGSLGSFKWYDPLLSSSCAYLQGKIHGTKFLDAFTNTSLPIPSIQHPGVSNVLNNWYKKSLRTKLFRKITRPDSTRNISSVFDMFTDKSNQLYVFNRPATAMKINDTRVPNIILPIPQQLQDVVIPLFNAYQLDTVESDDASTSNYPYPKRSQRTTSIKSLLAVQKHLITTSSIQCVESNPENDVHAQVADVHGTKLSNYTIQCDKSRIITPQQAELILEYLDLPRMREEIHWILDQCRLFPIVTTHNDFHSLNVLLLDRLLESSTKVKTAHSSADGHVISIDSDQPTSAFALPSTTPPGASLPYPIADLKSQPWPLPNDSLPWIKVIDYEYGGLNYRGYDTANSQNESQIVYDGGMPGFSLDLPAWVTTQCLGVYNPSVLNLQDGYKEAVQDIVYEQQFEHVAIHKQLYDSDRLDNLVQVWNQREDERIAVNIQNILLGCHSNQVFDPKDNQKVVPPCYRPREILWIQSCLTGFYHSCIEQHIAHGKRWPQDPIQPFQTTAPSPHPGFLSHYTLPLTLEEWLEEQTPLLLYETMILQFASQMAWIQWGIVYTETATIQGFGYLEHSLARMIAYIAKKEVMIKLGLLNAKLHQDFIAKHSQQ